MTLTFPELEREKIVNSARKTLWTNEGAAELEYLRKVRCISDEEIKAMHFGYIPLRASEFFRSRELYDLSGRLVMPLYDPYGQLVVLTTRDRRPETPKEFAHRHETFEKSNYLYGLHLAKPHMIRSKVALVVEGQFDAAYLRSIGFGYTVAILGTAMSIRQASILSRYCSQIYLFFDGDKGGRQATERTLEMAKEADLGTHGISVIPIETPEGKDPDDFNSAEVISLCKNARVMHQVTRKNARI